MVVFAGTGVIVKHLILSEGLGVAVSRAKKRVQQKVESGEAEDAIEAVEQLVEEGVQSVAQWMRAGQRFVHRMHRRLKRGECITEVLPAEAPTNWVNRTKRRITAFLYQCVRFFQGIRSGPLAS